MSTPAPVTVMVEQGMQEDPPWSSPGPDDMDSDDSDFEESYFAKTTYRPLSNLPTPPLSSQGSFTADSGESLLEEGEVLDSGLLGSAIHLVNLLPPGASLATPSVPLVHAILTRANLPLDSIALAVCILDSLDHKFSLNWRITCPLAGPEHPPPSPAGFFRKRHTLAATHDLATDHHLHRQLHIDSVFPEVIVLAALVLSFKFLEDRNGSTQYFAAKWGRSLWTCAQINATERCIVESLGYRLLPLWDPELIGDARADMERAGRYAQPRPVGRKPSRLDVVGGPEGPERPLMSSGKAVQGLAEQLTPAETPVSEPAALCFVIGQS